VRKCWSSQLQGDRIPPVKRPAAIPQHAIKIAVYGFGTALLNDGAFTGEPAIDFAVLGSAAARPRRQSHGNVLCNSDTITDFQLFLPASLLRTATKPVTACASFRLWAASAPICVARSRPLLALENVVEVMKFGSVNHLKIPCGVPSHAEVASFFALCSRMQRQGSGESA
jgi:hypothetical protein